MSPASIWTLGSIGSHGGHRPGPLPLPCLGHLPARLGFCQCPIGEYTDRHCDGSGAMVPTPRRLCSQWKRAPPSWAPPSWELGPPSVCREVQCHILCPHCACGQGCSPISQRMTLRLLSDLRVPGPDHKASVPSLWQRLPVRCLPWPLQQPLLPERRRTAVLLPRREGAVVMIQSFGFGAPSAQ